MKIKHLISFIIMGLVFIGSANFINKVLAQGTTNSADIQYPVAELGNCKNQSACRSYCDKPENTNVCLDFAEKNNLMSKEEIGLAKKFVGSGSKGPGGCSGKGACSTYCDNITHIDECVAFAEKNGLMSSKELEEAKKVQSAIAKGVKPPACGNKKECDVYCEDSNHMEECINFGVAAGFIQGKELEDSQKMLAAIKRGVKPLPCKGRKACDEYCGNPDNMEVCVNFASEAGFMNEREKEDSQKMLAAIKKGVRPPNCRGKEECDNYCGQEDNMEECTNFAEAAGFMTSEEAKMARKTGGKGPGGCRGKEECEVFCGNPDNQETCFNFAKDNGMMSEKDLKRTEEGKRQMKQSLKQVPEEVLDCLKTEVGAGLVERMKDGVMPSKEMGDKMQNCFQKMGPPKPGTINPGGQMMPQQAGPGGCKGPEECKSYCDSHPDECKDQGSNGQQFAPGTGPLNPNEQENQQDLNGIERQMPQVQPCEGEKCQPPIGTQPSQPRQQPTPSSTEPGMDNNLVPREPIPLMSPTEQQPQQLQSQPPVLQQNPSPPPLPSSFLQGVQNILANVFSAFWK